MKFFSRDKTLYASFFTMTFTIALQNVIVYGVNLADNIMIGAYSQTAMSGIALVNQVQFFLQMITMGAAEGIVVIASRCWGQRDTEGIKKVASVGMRTGVLGAAVIWAAMFFIPSQVLGLFADESASAVIAEGVVYARIVCFSYIFFAVTNILIATMRSVETVKIGFYVSLSALLVNILLNYLLIYGVWIFPEMGAAGAAVATLISRFVELCVVLIFIIRHDDKLKLRFSDYLRFDSKMFVSYIKVSLPVIASSGMWGIAQGVQTGILGHLGEDVIAANSIASTVFQIISVVIYGSASATAVIIGKTLGQGRRELIPEYTRTLQVIYIGLGLLTGAALFGFKDIVIGLYKITDAARSYALQFMTINSVTVVGTAYQMTCMTGIARGGGDTKSTLINDTIHMWLIVIPASMIAAFALKLSPAVVFACLKCDQILKCGVAAVWTNSYRWIKKLD